MANVFISFVGLGNPNKTPGYDSAVYTMDDPVRGVVRKARETVFAQAAIIELLGASYFDRIILLCTEDSKRTHFEMLKMELISLGCSEEAIKMPEYCLPTDMTSDVQWEWFEHLLEEIEYEDTLTFDFTHGMRSVPIVFSSAIGFLTRAKKVTLDHVLYGWYDKNRPVNEHPIVDMKEFYEINNWAESVSRLIEDADAKKLGEVAGVSDIPALKCLGESELVNAFEKMTDCIRNVDVNNIASSVSEALKIVDKHRGRASGSAKLLLDQVTAKFASLAFDVPVSGKYDIGYFKTQISIIDVLIEHRLFMQAYTAMRECIASIGMLGFNSEEIDMSSEGGRDKRIYAEVFIAMVKVKPEKWEFGKNENKKDELVPFYEELKRIGIFSRIKKVIHGLTEYRNGFDHAWTSKTGAYDNIESKGIGFREKVSDIIDELIEREIMG